jgi:hypothetical protein
MVEVSADLCLFGSDALAIVGINPEDGGSTIPQIVWEHSPNDAVSHPRRLDS